MTEEELKTIYQLYTGLWRMFKAYHAVRTDEQWEQCIDHAAGLVEQYGEDTRPLVLDTLELLEMRRKARRKK
ncbi:MAG: hypothetical protein ACI4DR_03540 [Roseburia sp.]